MSHSSRNTYATAAIFVVVVFLLVTYGIYHFRAPVTDSPALSDTPTAHPLATAAVMPEIKTLSSPTPGAAHLAATPHDREQLQMLSSVLEAHNDNDPRMDHELRELSPAARALMREKYTSLPAEKRNARGTIAFLLSRQITTPEDSAFLKSILEERPCLSLGDCTRDDRTKTSPGNQSDDENNGVNTTLAYPQIVALIAIENALAKAEKGEKIPGFSDLRQAAETACDSPVRALAGRACPLRDRFRKL